MKPIRIFTVIIFLLANSFTIHAQSQKEKITPQDSIQNAYDFWIGNWEVSWTAPDSSLVKGSNRVKKILDGKVIQENFVDPPETLKVLVFRFIIRIPVLGTRHGPITGADIIILLENLKIINGFL